MPTKKIKRKTPREAAATRVSRSPIERDPAKSQKLALALDEATRAVKKPRNLPNDEEWHPKRLPAYLVQALLRFADTIQQRTDLVIIDQRVQNASFLKKSGAAGRGKAVERAAESLGLQVENVEKKYYAIKKEGGVSRYPASPKRRKK